MIGEHPVLLFGHRARVAAQTRLHMCDRDVELARRQRSRQGGVGIPVDQDAFRTFFQQHLFYAGEHPGGLPAVARGTDTEVDIGMRDAHLAEEDFRHVVIVVLAGVQQTFAQAARVLGANQAADDGRLDELGSGSDDSDDVDNGLLLGRLKSGCP